ncbi:MAG: hypothetical protein IKP50_04330 [Bacilli bacterium]|nr:hypothetical protein [Bacilli bacterium]
MKKILQILLIPLLISCASIREVAADDTNDFVATELTITEYNINALQYKKTDRGVKISKADSATSTDAFLRFDSINETHAVKVKTNKYIAIRYRSNYDPQFVLRIKSTSGNRNWSDFRFSETQGHIENTIGTWNTYVFPLNFENASSVSEGEYNQWVEGDYLGVSFNILNNASFSLESSYLYISSFAFFSTEAAANAYGGLDYASSADTVGPTITIPFGDGTTFNTTAGKSYEFTADAYDEYDDLHFAVQGVLSDGALDANNKLVQGSHTVTFTARDLSNNESTKVLNLIVGERDTVAPIINCSLETIYVPVGAYNCLAFTATDAIDGEIKCEYSYSANAVDSKNRFLEGTHTLTITATDLTGNIATKNITIVVSNNFNPNNLEVITEVK